MENKNNENVVPVENSDSLQTADRNVIDNEDIVLQQPKSVVKSTLIEEDEINSYNDADPTLQATTVVLDQPQKLDEPENVQTKMGKKKRKKKRKRGLLDDGAIVYRPQNFENENVENIKSMGTTVNGAVLDQPKTFDNKKRRKNKKRDTAYDEDAEDVCCFAGLIGCNRLLQDVIGCICCNFKCCRCDTDAVDNGSSDCCGDCGDCDCDCDCEALSDGCAACCESIGACCVGAFELVCGLCCGCVLAVLSDD